MRLKLKVLFILLCLCGVASADSIESNKDTLPQHENTPSDDGSTDGLPLDCDYIMGLIDLESSTDNNLDSKCMKRCLSYKGNNCFIQLIYHTRMQCYLLKR